jgi:hypothetical protein
MRRFPILAVRLARRNHTVGKFERTEMDVLPEFDGFMQALFVDVPLPAERTHHQTHFRHVYARRTSCDRSHLFSPEIKRLRLQIVWCKPRKRSSAPIIEGGSRGDGVPQSTLNRRPQRGH